MFNLQVSFQMITTCSSSIFVFNMSSQPYLSIIICMQSSPSNGRICCVCRHRLHFNSSRGIWYVIFLGFIKISEAFLNVKFAPQRRKQRYTWLLILCLTLFSLPLSLCFNRHMPCVSSLNRKDQSLFHPFFPVRGPGSLVLRPHISISYISINICTISISYFFIPYVIFIIIFYHVL